MRLKFTLLFLGLLFSGSLLAQNTPELFWYKFDGTGNTVPNLALTPPAGTATGNLFGGMTQNTPGICNGALIGTGGLSSADYMSTNWIANLPGAWTISFRTQDITPSSTLWYIFGDASAGGLRIFTNGVAGANNWILRGGFSDVLISGGAVMTPTMNTWVYDPLAGNIKAYLNGVLVNTVAQSSVPISGTTGPLKIGSYSSSNGLPAGGKMDDVRIYNRALSAQEVADIYAGDPGSFLGPDDFVCTGDTLTLSAPAGGTYLWSDNSTNSTLDVTQAGTYSVDYIGACESGSDTITISQVASPSPGFAGPDTTICVGDTVTLMTGYPGDTTLWSTGDSTAMITVTTPATYTVTITGQCGSFMDTVNVNASALVYTGFAMADTNAACVGDTITLSSANMYDTYAWTGGSTGSTLGVTSSGIYSLSVTDACGSGTDSVSVSFTQPVAAAFTSVTNFFDVNFTNTSTGGGTVTYSWDFGDGSPASTAANPTHTYANNGTYTVTLTVTNECGTDTFTTTVTILVAGVDAARTFTYEVYPNPAQNEVRISGALTGSGKAELKLLTPMGQVIRAAAPFTVAGQWSYQLNLNDIAAGVYFLQVNINGENQTTRLVISK